MDQSQKLGCIYGIQFNAKFLASYPYFQGSKDWNPFH